jgi:copper ion binding protein
VAIESVQIAVEGMTCANCARSVERKLAATPGVSKATVNLEAGKASVEYDPGRVQPDALANAIRQLGYEVPQ